MTKQEAISLVKEYLAEENLRIRNQVPIYTNTVKLKIVQLINFLKYKKRLSILNGFQITDWIKHDKLGNDYMVIKESKITESNHFWIIPCNSFKFFKDYDIRYGIIGLGPIIIQKKSRKMFRSFTSSLDILDKIKSGEELNSTTLNDRLLILN